MSCSPIAAALIAAPEVATFSVLYTVFCEPTPIFASLPESISALSAPGMRTD